MSSSLVGRTLGKYKIIDNLGQGGMASVYLGYQEDIDRRVAVKVLPPHPGLDEQFIERFRLEARTIARLQHPHILPLYDYGMDEEILYLVMAYVDGGTLDNYIEDGPMQLRMVEKILREVAEALDYAHRQGVIHRDIKPGNILIDSEGHALLADFGIVKLVGEASNLTGTGVVGTPNYMAPEQAAGDPIDHRADIYSLGVVVFEMVTGQQPFTASTPMQVMLQVIQEPAPDVLSVAEGVPPEIGPVMSRVLSKFPDARYQSATEFAEAFTQAIRGSEDARAAALNQSDAGRTTRLDPPDTRERQSQETTKDSQTIIVHQGINPILLLAGFALIAAALVVVVLLVVNNQEDSGPGLATQVAEATEQATPTQAPPSPTPIPAAPTFGEVTYSNAEALGDSLRVEVEGLAPPATDQVYVAWLLDTEDSDMLKLGEISLDPFGDGALPYTDSDGRMLPTEFNALLISSEEDAEVEELTGEVVYSGSVPAAVSEALREIFVASENGFDGGSLLDGARTEASTGAQHAGFAATAAAEGNLGGMHTHAEHTVNIFKGETVDYNDNGRGENPGRGVGVYQFMDWIEFELDSAINAPGAGRQLQNDAELIRVCLQNTRLRADQVVELEMQMIAAESPGPVQEQAAESAQVAGEVLTGFDHNQNGRIEAFEEECGLDQIDTFGVLVGNIDVHEGPLETEDEQAQ